MNYKAIYSDDTMERLMDVLDECGTCTSEIVTCGPRYMLCAQDARGRELVISVWANQVFRIERICSCCKHTEVIWIALETQPVDVMERVNKYLSQMRRDWVNFWSIDNAAALFQLALMSDDLNCVRPLVDDEGDPIMPVDDATRFVLNKLKACLDNMN